MHQSKRRLRERKAGGADGSKLTAERQNRSFGLDPLRNVLLQGLIVVASEIDYICRYALRWIQEDSRHWKELASTNESYSFMGEVYNYSVKTRPALTRAIEAPSATALVELFSHSVFQRGSVNQEIVPGI
jgi:hypothetical protein